MRKITFSILLLLLYLISNGQPNKAFNCSTDIFKQNKNNTSTQAEREIIIPIHWIEVYQTIKFMTSLSTNLGQDVAYMKTSKMKISLIKYEKQIDSLILALQEIKVITETEDLVESEYCYLLRSKQNITQMGFFITNKDVPAGVKKAMDFISRNKTEDHLAMAKVGEILNAMAKRYDLYKYR